MYLLEPKNFDLALDKLVEEKFIIANNDEGCIFYEFNPHLFWKGDSDKHDEVIECSWKESIEEQEVVMDYDSKLNIKSVHSHHKLQLKKKMLNYVEEIFNANTNLPAV